MTSRILLWLAVALLLAVTLVAQEDRTAHVCVAVMQNKAGRSVPGNLERDRLVRALNREKPDKKSGVSLRAQPIDASDASEVRSELAVTNCEYVVYTTLTELRGRGDPAQRRPGTIETSPDSQWGRGQGPEQEFRATVEFKLVRVSDGSEIAAAPYSTQQSMIEADVVSQLMDRIANSVRSEIRKEFPSN